MLKVEAVRSIMRERNVSVSELARRMGRHRPDVSAYVNGRRQPKTTSAKAMAAALGCSLDDLIEC